MLSRSRPAVSTARSSRSSFCSAVGPALLIDRSI
jgi:hypothetical protein